MFSISFSKKRNILKVDDTVLKTKRNAMNRSVLLHIPYSVKGKEL